MVLIDINEDHTLWAILCRSADEHSNQEKYSYMTWHEDRDDIAAENKCTIVYTDHSASHLQFESTEDIVIFKLRWM